MNYVNKKITNDSISETTKTITSRPKIKSSQKHKKLSKVLRRKDISVAGDAREVLKKCRFLRRSMKIINIKHDTKCSYKSWLKDGKTVKKSLPNTVLPHKINKKLRASGLKSLGEKKNS